MYGPLDKLDKDELLICLFFRGEGQLVDHVDARDFERRMYLKPPEGGISFFRAKTTDYKFIVNKVGRTPLLNRGIASVSIGRVLQLGFHICGDLKDDDKHLCLHCQGCDCVERNCKPTSKTCSFIPPEAPSAENDRMRRQLADSMLVIIEAKKNRAELLEIFGKDVPGAVEEMNAEYARRFDVALKKTSSESSAR